MSDFEKCPICKQYGWLTKHTCPPAYGVRQSDCDREEEVEGDAEDFIERGSISETFEPIVLTEGNFYDNLEGASHGSNKIRRLMPPQSLLSQMLSNEEVFNEWEDWERVKLEDDRNAWKKV